MYKNIIALFLLILPMLSFSSESEVAFMDKMKPYYRANLAPFTDQEFGSLNINKSQKEKYTSIFIDSLASCYLDVIKSSYGQKYLEVALEASSKGVGFLESQQAMQMKLISDIEEGILDRQTGVQMVTKAEQNINSCVAKSERAMYDEIAKDGVK